MSVVAARGLFCALFLSLVFRCESLRNGMACNASLLPDATDYLPPGIIIRHNSCPMASSFCPFYVNGTMAYRSLDEPCTEIKKQDGFIWTIFVSGTE